MESFSYQLTHWVKPLSELKKPAMFLLEDSYPYKIMKKDGMYALFTQGKYILSEYERTWGDVKSSYNSSPIPPTLLGTVEGSLPPADS